MTKTFSKDRGREKNRGRGGGGGGEHSFAVRTHHEEEEKISTDRAGVGRSCTDDKLKKKNSLKNSSRRPAGRLFSGTKEPRLQARRHVIRLCTSWW